MTRLTKDEITKAIIELNKKRKGIKPNLNELMPIIEYYLPITPIERSILKEICLRLSYTEFPYLEIKPIELQASIACHSPEQFAYAISSLKAQGWLLTDKIFHESKNGYLRPLALSRYYLAPTIKLYENKIYEEEKSIIQFINSYDNSFVLDNYEDSSFYK